MTSGAGKGKRKTENGDKDAERGKNRKQPKPGTSRHGSTRNPAVKATKKSNLVKSSNTSRLGELASTISSNQKYSVRELEQLVDKNEPGYKLLRAFMAREDSLERQLREERLKGLKLEKNLEAFRKEVYAKLRDINPLLAGVTRLDFSHHLKALPEEDDFANLYAGLNLMVEDLEVILDENKHRSQKLRDSEELYRTLVNTAQEGILLADPSETILFANPRMGEFLGYGHDELAGRSLLDFIPSEALDILRTQSSKRIKGETSRYELTLIDRKGKPRRMLVTAAPLYDSEGNYYAAMGVFTDIGDLKQTEEALQKSEEKHRLLMNSIPSPVLALTEDMKILYCNDSYAKLTAIAAESGDQLEGKSLLKVSPQFKKTESYKAYLEVLKTGESQEVEEKLGERFIRAHIYKTPWGILSINEDVTDRKHAEEALRERETLYRTLVDTAREAIILTDLDENVLFVNPMAGELLGYDSGEITGRSVLDFIPPKDREIIRSQTLRRVEGETSRYETTFIHRDGTPHKVLITGAPIFDADGRVSSTMAIVTDITEMSVINEISRAVSSTLDINEIFSVIHEQLKLFLNADNFYIALYDKELDEVSFPYAFQDGELQKWERRRGGKGMTEHVIHTGTPQLFREDSKKEATRRGVEHIGKPSHSWLGVPMIIRNQVIGVMTVQSFNSKITYSEKHIGPMQMVANQAAQAVENARSYSELQRRLTELSVFNEIGRALASTLRLDELMEVIYTQTCRVMDAENLYIALYDENTDMIEFPFFLDDGKRVNMPSRKSENSLTDYIIKSREPLLVNQYLEDTCRSLGIEMIISGEPPLSWLGVPMISQDRVIGVMSVQSTQRSNLYDEDHKRMLESIASQAAGMVANARAYTHLERRLTELSALNEIGRALGGTLQLDELLNVIYTQTNRIVEGETFYIALHDEDNDIIEFPLYIEDGKPLEMPARPFGNALTEYVIKTREPLLMGADIKEQERNLGIASFQHGEESHSWLGVPMISHDKVLGVISIQSTKPNLYDEDHKRILSSIANQAAGTIANARNYSELERRGEELGALLKTSTELSSTLDEEEVGRIIAERAKELIPSDGCTFYRFDKESEKLIPLASTVLEEYEQRMSYQVSLGEGVTGRAALERKPILSNNVHLDLEAPRIPGTKDLPTCLMSAPLVARGELMGDITLVRMSEEKFEEHDLQLFSLFARQAAEAFANSRFFSQLRKLNEDMKRGAAERQALLETSALVSSTLDEEEVTHIIAEKAAELIGADGCTVYRFDEEKEELVPQTTTVADGRKQILTHRIKPGEGVTGSAALERRTILANNVHLDPDATALPVTKDQPTCLLSTPLIAREELLGVMTLTRFSEKGFEEHDLELFTIFARQITDAAANSRLFGKLRELNENLEQKVTERTSELEEAKRRLEKIHSEYTERVRSRLATLAPILERVGQGDLSERIPMPEKEDEFTDLFRNLNLMIIDMQKLVQENLIAAEQLKKLNEDLEAMVAERTLELESANERLKKIHSQYQENVRKRLATVAPVMEKVSLGDFSENVPIHEEEDEFTELFVGLNLMIDDLRFMFDENRKRSDELKELNVDLEHRGEELKALLDASTVIASTLDEYEVANLIAERATGFIKSERCTVYRYDAETEELIPQTTTSSLKKVLDHKISIGKGVTGKAAAERRPIIANNVHLDSNEEYIPDTKGKPTCLIAVPLLSKEELLGAMTLLRLSEEAFTDHDLELFTLLARQVADAIANSRLLSRLKELNENLEAMVKQRTAELEESNRQTSAFARELEEVIYVASHDLKTPLRAISGFSQFLYEDYRDKLDREAQLYLTRLVDATKRMEQLLDDLLDISAVTRTEQVFKRIPSGDLIKEAIKQVNPSSEVDVLYDPENLPDVFCDSGKIVEVFYNLIANGIKFNDKPQKIIKISVQSTAGFHEFIVEDNGIGIEKRHYERIFKIFQRLHQRGEYAGTGVGLAMVKRIIEEHNGRIWVESQLGVGTIFHFTLPERQEDTPEGNLKGASDE